VEDVLGTEPAQSKPGARRRVASVSESEWRRSNSTSR
jgi:hypothetical protein